MDLICQSNRQQREYQDKEIDKDNFFPLIQITSGSDKQESRCIAYLCDHGNQVGTEF